jgi:hypothetical protein
MSVTRATTATRVNSAGLVELVPYNLLQQSNNFDTTWAINGTGGGTITSGQTDPNGETNAWIFSKLGLPGRIEQVLNIGGTQTFFIYAKKNTSDFISIIIFDGSVAHQCYFNLSTGTVGTQNASTGAIESVGNGWYKCIMTSTNLISSGVIQIYLSDNDGTITGTTGSVYIFNSQLNEGSTALPYQKTETRLNIPRLDYSNGTCPSLLVEPQRTNYFPYSQNIANWYEPDDGVTLTSNTIDTVSPDGTNNASKITIVGGNQRSYQITNSVSGTGTFSAYVKAGTSSTLTLYTSSASVLIGYNLSTLAVTQTIGTGTITSVGNGWYRITATNTLGANEVLQVLYTGNANETIYIWGFQVEAGSYATSYIPTTSASVTRNADVISKTGISSLIGQTEGTIFWDIYVDTPSATGHEDIFNIDNGSFGNTIYLFKASNATFTCEMYVSGSGQASFTKTGVTAGRHKIAFAYANNNTAMFFDGVQVGSTDTSCSVPTMSRIQLGQGALGPSTGFTNAAALWQTRLDNATLAQLTTI